MNRRSFLGTVVITACGRNLVAAEACIPSPLTPDQSLKALMDGNQRFVAQKSTYSPNQTKARVVATANCQAPFAAVLSCADSRVPPEVVFDQGLGALFVVRVAGNIADPSAIASLEYAVDHLGVRLIYVLGHERCGAVNGAVGLFNAKKQPEGHFGALNNFLSPAVVAADVARRKDAAAGKAHKDDLVEDSVRENVKFVVGQLSSEFKGKLGKIAIKGGRYDLDSGSVTAI